ncbi:MAG: FHA domain-containing protein [Deltaproteobacteria bacterium]|nr:MAG: FHA domain-containing protein [Deltaproteobacteria bacterium]
MPALTFSLAGGAEVRYVLPMGRTLLGRSEGCDIALPDDEISRTHCIVERRANETWVIDRSRNGTLVNGMPVRRERLRPGSLIEVGRFRLRYTESTGTMAASTSAAVRPLPHEELVAADGQSIAALRACLRFTRGPRTDEVVVVKRSVLSLGGADDDIELEGLPPRALKLRTARGRVVLDPLPAVRVFLAGSPAHVPTPVWPGEEIQVGEHSFIIDVQVDQEDLERESFGALVGAAPSMRKLFGVLGRIAAHDHTALITGESGTGKELAAQAIHQHGPRSSGPFVPVNCAALPENLVESELFGHERGAFTGADAQKPGAFQLADGGTLFLDEVGELRLDTQAKLLRALESGEVRRVGARKSEIPDVRVIAATNRDLARMVAEGTFREDLRFRLSVLTVTMPPLRDRLQDVPLVAQALLERNVPDATLHPSALTRLQQHVWPGNVRELRNVLVRARVLYGPLIMADSLSFEAPAPPLHAPVSEQDLLNPSGQATREAIVRALERAGGNRTRAAQLLGVPRSSLLYRMKKHGIV